MGNVETSAALRASEPAQMRLDGVRTERGILVFATKEEAKNNRRAELWSNLKTALQGRFSIPDSDALHS